MRLLGAKPLPAAAAWVPLDLRHVSLLEVLVLASLLPLREQLPALAAPLVVQRQALVEEPLLWRSGRRMRQ